MECKKKKVSNINFTWHEEVTQGCVCLNMCGLLFLADVLKSFFFFLSFGHCLSIMSPFFCVRFLRNVFLLHSATVVVVLGGHYYIILTA